MQGCSWESRTGWARRRLLPRALWNTAQGLCDLPPRSSPRPTRCFRCPRPAPAPPPSKRSQLSDTCLSALTEEFAIDKAPVGVLGSRFLKLCADKQGGSP